MKEQQQRSKTMVLSRIWSDKTYLYDVFPLHIAIEKAKSNPSYQFQLMDGVANGDSFLLAVQFLNMVKQ